MKIATWNLERCRENTPRGLVQQEALSELRLSVDVLVLTEPPATYREAPGIVTSPARRRGPAGNEAWVAIVGASVEPVALEIPYERTAVAARATIGGAEVLIYGAVLPWLSVTKHAPELVLQEETSLTAFKRVLNEQVRDILELRRLGRTVLWAGDFNQSVSGKILGGSQVRRDVLCEALTSLGMVAWNGEQPHAREGLRAVDLICGPRELAVTSQGRIDPGRGRVTMSDHAGYWVDLGFARQ